MALQRRDHIGHCQSGSGTGQGDRNTSGLASTGASILVPVVLGLVLLAGGAGALLFLRRRRA